MPKLSKHFFCIFLLLVLVVSLIPFFHIPKVNAIITTSSFVSTNADGSVRNQSTTYSEVHDALTANYLATDNVTYYIGQFKSGSTRYIHRSAVYFDTSSLENVSMISAKLRLYGASDSSTTEFNITIQNGQPTYPHSTLEIGDYYYAHYSGDGGKYDTTNGWSIIGYNNVTLTSTGVGWINKTGTTKLFLRSSRDIDSINPTGQERVAFCPSEYPSNKRPLLEVTYETFYYSNIGITSDTLNTSCIFSVKWAESANGLSGYIFGTNNTGAWVNDTWTDPWSGSPNVAWCNVTKTLNSTINMRVEFRVWVNSSINVWKSIPLQWLRTVSQIDTSTPLVPAEAVKYSLQRKFGVAKNILWFFYVNFTNLVFRSSTDWGNTWSTATIVDTMPNDKSGSFSLEFSGDYIHYVLSGATLKYRRGLMNANKTITWDSYATIVDETNYDYKFPSIAINTTGYPWIGYLRFNLTTNDDNPYVVKSEKKDGTWTTTSGFPYQMNATDHIFWTTVPVPLSTIGEMYVVYGHDDEGWQGRLYDGSWDSVETVSTSLIECAQRNAFASYQDEVRVTYHVLNGNHIYVKRFSNGTWTSEYTVATNVGESATPTLTIDSFGNDYIFWFDANSVLYYRIRGTSGWEDAEQWVNENLLPLAPSALAFATQLSTNAQNVGVGWVTTVIKFTYIPYATAPTFMNTSGTISLTFTIEQVKNIAFGISGAINFLVNISSLATAIITTLTAYGSITMTLMDAALKSMLLNPQGNINLQFTITSKLASTMNLQATINLLWTIQSTIAATAPGLLRFYGSILLTLSTSALKLVAMNVEGTIPLTFTVTSVFSYFKLVNLFGNIALTLADTTSHLVTFYPKGNIALSFGVQAVVGMISGTLDFFGDVAVSFSSIGWTTLPVPISPVLYATPEFVMACGFFFGGIGIIALCFAMISMNRNQKEKDEEGDSVD